MGQAEELRGNNAYKVFDLLSTSGGVTRPELAKKTGLSRATVGLIIDGLKKKNYVRESGIGDSSGGRPPVVLEFNPDAAHAVGAGMYDNQWSVLLTNLHGRIIDRETVVMTGSSPEHAVNAIKIGIDTLRDRNSRMNLLPRVGIGSPGLVDYKTGTVISAVDVGWSDVPLAAMVEKATGLKALIANRGKLGALAEYWRMGKSCKELVYISVGTGIAAGIIHMGDLYIGPTSSAGELGHATIQPEGPLCACGNRGCLQQLCSESAIAVRARELIRSVDEGPLKEIAGTRPELISSGNVIAAADRGDRVAITVLREAAESLGIAAANIVNLLNPERILLGGPVSCSSSLFCTMVRESIERRSMAYPLSIVTVEQCRLGLEAGAVGAAVLVLEEIPALLFDLR